MNRIQDRFLFRNIRREETEQAVRIETICFPPNEACKREHMLERIQKAPELFLTAEDRKTGKIAGFLNGLAVSEKKFRDEFFTDASLHEENGENIMLLGLDVLPEYRMQGLARALMETYAQREAAKGRKALILTCLENKVEMYRKMGFQSEGLSASSWGGEAWYEMRRELNA